jgi:hypothetical protein
MKIRTGRSVAVLCETVKKITEHKNRSMAKPLNPKTPHFLGLM